MGVMMNANASIPFQVFSVVRTVCLRKALGRGTILALLGIFPLMLSAILLPAEILHGLGVVLFGFFLFCLLCGLLPYKRLAKKQLHPDSLYVENSLLIYTKNGHIKKRIPIDSILSLHPLTRHPSDYGIRLVLKNKTDLFFPHFTAGCAASLQEVLSLQP